jgi:N-methylhydantoinase B
MIKTDKVTLEVLKSYFVAISEGMAHTLERAAHTTFVKENGDCATGIATPEGEFFSYPRHVGAVNLLGASLRAIIGSFDDYSPGDIVMSNDPYATEGLASHLPDVHLIKPIFVGDEILCFAWAFVHTSDVGGLVAASLTPRAYEVQQEGIRIPPKKLYRAGILNQDLLDVFLNNCRIPDQNWGDLK